MTQSANIAGLLPLQPDTPVIRQWRQFKKQHPDYLVLFKVGDFYETFEDDARTAAKILGVTLTHRHKEGFAPVAMAGLPHHSVEGYLRKLIAAGHRVAIAEPNKATPETATPAVIPLAANGESAEQPRAQANPTETEPHAAVKTRTRRRHRNFTAEELELVRAWLQHYDRSLYGEWARIKDVRQQIAVELGIKKPKAKIPRDCCRWWRSKRPKSCRPSVKTKFDSEEWFRMTSWVRAHQHEIDLKLDTDQSILRRMREVGVLASLEGVRESLAFFGIDLSSNPPPFRPDQSNPPPHPRVGF